MNEHVRELESVPFVLTVLEAADLYRGKLETLPFFKVIRENRARREDYVWFLSDLYHIVLHFCPTMAAAASRCGPCDSSLRIHLYQSIYEEQGHEQMVLEDLAHFGVPAAKVVNSVPSPAVFAMIGANYHGADRGNPCSVLGMLYVLEFLASVYANPIADNLAAGLAVDGDEGFNFLRLHGSLDQVHVARLHELMSALPDDGARESVIQYSRLNFYLLEQWLSGFRQGRAQ